MPSSMSWPQRASSAAEQSATTLRQYSNSCLEMDCLCSRGSGSWCSGTTFDMRPPAHSADRATLWKTSPTYRPTLQPRLLASARASAYVQVPSPLVSSSAHLSRKCMVGGAQFMVPWSKSQRTFDFGLFFSPRFWGLWPRTFCRLSRLTPAFAVPLRTQHRMPVCAHSAPSQQPLLSPPRSQPLDARPTASATACTARSTVPSSA
mmetsp:Transcript_6411/g.19960  ORF Transcript_6411/g.19960 Transcript_6411/m.19960 type:complete len:205 (-) Transcript_6411:360-974(-)